MTSIPSSQFEHSYSIFIRKQAAPHMAKWVNLSTWLKQNSVKVLESTDRTDDLAVIVIPVDKDVKLIEEKLFEFKSKHTQAVVRESGFWGRIGIGIKDKTWTVV